MTRFDFLRTLGVFTGSTFLLGTASCKHGSFISEGIELIGDPDFEQGALLIDPENPSSFYGTWKSTDLNAPVWKITQWGTKERLVPKGESLSLCNEYKAVCLRPSALKGNSLILSVLGNQEYSGSPREAGTPWVHLLLEQSILSAPRLVDLKYIRFHLEACLLKSSLRKPELFDPQIHAAQYFVYFYLQDYNKSSDGYGEMIWFGIPVYDNRVRMPLRYEAQDFAGSGMFIYTLDQNLLSDKSTHDKKWITLEADLLDEMKQAFTSAQKHGYMQKTKRLGDIFITGMNIGWEVPGLLDVSMEVRNLSLKASRI